MCLDIEERHLLRLGHGEEELATEKDFSRYGRVNFILALRMELLKEVERLKVSHLLKLPLHLHQNIRRRLYRASTKTTYGKHSHCLLWHSIVVLYTGNVMLLIFFPRRVLALVEMCRTHVRQLVTSSSTRSWQDGRNTRAKSRH